MPARSRVSVKVGIGAAVLVVVLAALGAAHVLVREDGRDAPQAAAEATTSAPDDAATDKPSPAATPDATPSAAPDATPSAAPTATASAAPAPTAAPSVPSSTPRHHRASGRASAPAAGAPATPAPATATPAPAAPASPAPTAPHVPVPSGVGLVLAADTGVADDGVTANPVVRVSGLVDGLTWQYRTRGGAWRSGAGDTFTLADGTYGTGEVEARIESSTGDSRTVRLPLGPDPLVVDTSAPTSPTLAASTASATAGAQVTVDGLLLIGPVEADATVEVRIDSGAWAAQPATDPVRVPVGLHSVDTRVIDLAGNVASPAGSSWTMRSTMTLAEPEITPALVADLLAAYPHQLGVVAGGPATRAKGDEVARAAGDVGAAGITGALAVTSSALTPTNVAALALALETSARVDVLGTAAADTIDLSALQVPVDVDGGDGDDVITAGARGGTLTGGQGDDTLTAGGGGTALAGGPGDDIYVIGAGASITEDAGNGTDLVRTDRDLLLGPNVENATVVTASGVTITGNSAANTIVGGSGDDVIHGAGGDDTLQGGGGADELYGEAGLDVLDGGAGSDRLDGGAGDDQASGGPGNDRFAVADAGDTLTEAAAAGSDWADVWVTPYTMPANIETAAGQLSTAMVLTGNTSDNLILGGAGGDTISGGGGDDQLQGRDGDDTLLGGDGVDILVGGNGNNVLVGGRGRDTLYAGGSSNIFVMTEADMVDGAGPLGGADLVSGLISGADSFRLDIWGLPGGPLGTLVDDTSTNAFAGTATDGSSPAVVLSHWNSTGYDSASYYLWVDLDGFGPEPARMVADLQSSAISASDIVIAAGVP